MIRINLLGVAKAKGKRQSATSVSMETGEGGKPLLKVMMVLVAAGVLNAGYWIKLDREKRSLEIQMAQAEAKNRELSEVKARYLERQRQAEAYKRRVDVIDQLRANQAGPVNLLNTIGDTVNKTEAVWLSNMKDQGNSIDIEGVALSSDAVANLITNLQKSGYFRNVEIKETFQDNQVKEMQAFVFTLTCEKSNEKAKS
jgi:type IV pilus assembly protein PilN